MHAPGLLLTNFNPRSLAGATYDKKYNRRNDEFQSTLPRGSDNGAKYKIPRYYHFNPRSLAGATLFSRVFFNFFRISIHAPSRERLIAQAIGVTAVRFQSTLPRGSDWCL